MFICSGIQTHYDLFQANVQYDGQSAEKCSCFANDDLLKSLIIL